MAEHNFIAKIKEHKFSMKNDFDKTVKGIDNLIQQALPLFKITGLDTLVRASERTFGTLNYRARNHVATAYALGTINLGYGVASHDLLFVYKFLVAYYGLGLMYHLAMSDEFDDSDKI